MIQDNISPQSNQSNNSSQSRQNQYRDLIVPHRYGSLHIKYLLYLFLPLLIWVCIYCYHQAVSKKEQKPFPHATITQTACHFSQDITFRFIQLSSISFLQFLYFVTFMWVKMIIRRTEYPGDNLSWLYPLAQLSIFGLEAALGTIDGVGTGNIHTKGAIFFFIVLYVLDLNITLKVIDLHKWDSSCISIGSLRLKSIACLTLSLVVFYCLYGVVMKSATNDSDKYAVILEWNLVLQGLGWLLTFASDWKSVFITLKGDFADTVRQI